MPASLSEKEYYEQLNLAVERDAYPQVCHLLDQLTSPMPLTRWNHLMISALSCSVRIFAALLYCCPVPEQIPSLRFEVGTPSFRTNCSLAACAAAMDAVPHLRLLAWRGIPIMEHDPRDPGPLETALLCYAPHALLYLRKTFPDYKPPISRCVSCAWYVGMVTCHTDPDRALCISLFFAPDPEQLPDDLSYSDGSPVNFLPDPPLPDDLDLASVARMKNWNLLLRRCLEHDVDPADTRKAIRLLDPVSFDFEYQPGGPSCYEAPPSLYRLLDVLFSACPALQRCHYAQSLLAIACLSPDTYEDEDVSDLRPLLRQLPGHFISLIPCKKRWTGPDGLLSRWDEVVGPDPAPGLDRCHPNPDRLRADSWEPEDSSCRTVFYAMAVRSVSDEEMGAYLDELITRCRVTGPVHPDTLSPLAQAAARFLPMDTLLRELAPGGCFSAESRDALRELVGRPDFPRSRVDPILAAIDPSDPEV